MSALSEPVTVPADGFVARPRVTAGHVDSVVGGLRTMDLPTLESQAALLTRVDRKYVVPLGTFERLVSALGDDWRALEIEGRRVFGYSSTYFDTEDLLTYRAHLQRRRKRYKIRVRHYFDSDACMLEVKRKGPRGLTIKRRRPHPSWQQTALGVEGHAFVDAVLRDHAPLPPTPLRPVVVTTNRRATLVCVGGGSRLTVDTDLVCGWRGAVTVLRSDHVLLESKVEGHGSAVDRILRSLGERPVEISKYCLGIAALGLDLPSNPWHHTRRRYFESPQH